MLRTEMPERELAAASTEPDRSLPLADRVHRDDLGTGIVEGRGGEPWPTPGLVADQGLIS